MSKSTAWPACRALGSLALVAVFALTAAPAEAIIRQRTLQLPQVPAVGTIRYGISVPDNYDSRPSGQLVPLVLTLHPGGARMPGYGAAYLAQFFMTPLVPLNAIIVAPDCPTRAWTDADADRAVMALLENVMSEYAVDRRRILVAGYSLGGHGTWFMSARHADFFTAAIAIAGSPERQPHDSLGRIPTYVIHSRTDEVVPFGPDQQTSQELEKLGRPVKFEAVNGGGHFDTASYLPAFTRAVAWVGERWLGASR
jgi:predicted peptidase